jgi:DNA phosphorothioation-associated putative methyltransferase
VNDLAEIRNLLSALGYGKKLPDAVYIFRPRESDVPRDLWTIILRATIAARPDPLWNLLKIHTDQFALTFLSYPDFDSDPHPALVEATKINLNSGSVNQTDYRQRSNPPILHRKETFLPSQDPRLADFTALTKKEEEAGRARRRHRDAVFFRRHKPGAGHGFVKLAGKGTGLAGFRDAFEGALVKRGLWVSGVRAA